MKLNKKMTWRMLQYNVSFCLIDGDVLPVAISDEYAIIWELGHHFIVLQNSQVKMSDLNKDLLYVKTNIQKEPLIIKILDR